MGYLGPYYSAALLQGGVRVLKDGTDLNQTGSFYLAARPYAEKNGAFIQGVLATFSELYWQKRWAYQRR